MSFPEQQDANSGALAGGNGEHPFLGSLSPIFEDACRITAPFFDPKQGWGGMSLTMYARQTLREAYPDLSQQEIAILFSAVQRFHQATTGQ